MYKETFMDKLHDFLYYNDFFNWLFFQHFYFLLFFLILSGPFGIFIRGRIMYETYVKKINILKNEYDLKNILLKNGFSELKYPLLCFLEINKKGTFCVGYERKINSYLNNNIFDGNISFVVDSDFNKFIVEYTNITEIGIYDTRLKNVNIPKIIKTNGYFSFFELESIIKKSFNINKGNDKNSNDIENLISYLKYK